MNSCLFVTGKIHSTCSSSKHRILLHVDLLHERAIAHGNLLHHASLHADLMHGAVIHADLLRRAILQACLVYVRLLHAGLRGASRWVLPHDVHHQAAPLNEVGLAVGTLVGPLPGVDPHVGQQVGVAREVFLAHFAQVRFLSQVAPGVGDPQVSLEKLLGAVLALVSPAHHVGVLPVAVQRVHGSEGLSAVVADEGAGFFPFGVHPHVVDVQAAFAGKHFVAHGAVVFPVPLCHLPMLLHHVRVQVESLGEHSSTSGTQQTALVSIEQQTPVVLYQGLPSGTEADTGDLALWVNTDVASDVWP